MFYCKECGYEYLTEEAALACAVEDKQFKTTTESSNQKSLSDWTEVVELADEFSVKNIETKDDWNDFDDEVELEWEDQGDEDE